MSPEPTPFTDWRLWDPSERSQSEWVDFWIVHWLILLTPSVSFYYLFYPSLKTQPAIVTYGVASFFIWDLLNGQYCLSISLPGVCPMMVQCPNRPIGGTNVASRVQPALASQQQTLPTGFAGTHNCNDMKVCNCIKTFAQLSLTINYKKLGWKEFFKSTSERCP